MHLLGKTHEFKVLKETPLGYMIASGKSEYFLHRSETAFKNIKAGDMVRGFIYTDKKGRLAATLHEPFITTEKFGFVSIVSVLKGTGVFVNIGISKDVLVSADDLGAEFMYWPQPGDKLLCRLKIKNERLLAKPLTREEVRRLAPLREPLGIINAFVFKILSTGLLFVSNEYDLIYVYTGAYRKTQRIGEEQRIRVIGKDELSYRGIFLVSALSDNKTLILDYLKKNHGVMTLTEKSSPDAINHVFRISKKSFKDALGGLYKDKLIDIMPDKIILL